jgi:hypothetical protein
VAGFARSLPEDMQRQLIFRRSPRLEIEFEGDGGGHVIRAIAADLKKDFVQPTCSWSRVPEQRSEFLWIRVVRRSTDWITV